MRRGKRARWHLLHPELVCLIFFISSFDLVKQLYLEYMSLFKFMRSDGVLSVIGIVYTLSPRCPFSSFGDNNILHMRGRVETATHHKKTQVTRLSVCHWV